MLISLWLYLLRNFIDDLSVSKPMSKQWPKYLCQILFSHRTASFLIPLVLEAPIFLPLSYIPAITPAAEVSAGVCARPEPCQGLAVSPLTHGANLCLPTRAQWDWEWGELSLRAGGEFPLAWRRFWGIFFTSSIPLAHFGPWMILDSCSEWNCRSGQSYEKPVESKTVSGCGILPKCVRHRFYKAALSAKPI